MSCIFIHTQEPAVIKEEPNGGYDSLILCVSGSGWLCLPSLSRSSSPEWGVWGVWWQGVRGGTGAVPAEHRQHYQVSPLRFIPMSPFSIPFVCGHSHSYIPIPLPPLLYVHSLVSFPCLCFHFIYCMVIHMYFHISVFMSFVPMSSLHSSVPMFSLLYFHSFGHVFLILLQWLCNSQGVTGILQTVAGEGAFQPEVSSVFPRVRKRKWATECHQICKPSFKYIIMLYHLPLFQCKIMHKLFQNFFETLSEVEAALVAKQFWCQWLISGVWNSTRPAWGLCYTVTQ